jgi:hypothetical protein
LVSCASRRPRGRHRREATRVLAAGKRTRTVVSLRFKVRLSDPSLADDLAAACRKVGLEARQAEDGVAVTPPPSKAGEPPNQDEVELLFFARSWALRHPGVNVDVREE